MPCICRASTRRARISRAGVTKQNAHRSMVDVRSAMRYDNSNDNPTTVRAMTIGDVLDVYAIDDDHLQNLLDAYKSSHGDKHCPSIDKVRGVLLIAAARHFDHKRKAGDYCDSTLAQFRHDLRGDPTDALAFLESIGVLTTIKRGGRNRAPHRRLNVSLISVIGTGLDPKPLLCDSYGIGNGINTLDRVTTPSKQRDTSQTSKSISNTTNAKNDAATACASSLPANNPYAINNINNGDTQ